MEIELIDRMPPQLSRVFLACPPHFESLRKGDGPNRPDLGLFQSRRVFCAAIVRKRYVYADLRSWSEPLRFAMKAARRAPRVHGITVSSLAAVAMTPLMKRVFFFMALILNLIWLRAVALA